MPPKLIAVSAVISDMLAESTPDSGPTLSRLAISAISRADVAVVDSRGIEAG